MSGTAEDMAMKNAARVGSRRASRGGRTLRRRRALRRPGRDRRGAALAAVPVLLLGAALTGLAVTAGAPGTAAPALPLPEKAFATCTSGLIGDVTGDDVVNITDAQQIARASVGLSVSATVQDRLLSHGDVTDDGTTNITDAQQIARWTVGLSTSFPIGEPCSGGGTLTAQNSTSGSNIPTSFELTLDGSIQLDMPANGEVQEPIDIGSHELVLTLPGNCTTDSSLTRTTTTSSDFPDWSVNWVIECV